MGSRPSTFKRGGGFLNGVDATITGYIFDDEFNGEAWKPGKIKGNDGKMMDRPHAMYMHPSFRADGADEDVTTTLKAGNFDAFDVSEDGLTLTAADGGPCNLGDKCGVGKFIESLVKAGFPESSLPDDPGSINFEPIVGTRVRLVQRTDEERTKKFGQRKDKKTGKSYDRQDLVVEDVYDLPQVETKSNGKAKTNGKAASPAKVTAKSKEVDVEQLAKDTLVAILTESKGSLKKAKLSIKSLTKLGKDPHREDVRALFFNEDFLEQQDGWSYDSDTETLTLDA